MDEQFEQVDVNPNQQQGGVKKSKKKKWLLGCGIGCLVMVILFAAVAGVGGYYAYKYAMGKVDAWSSEFEQKGYEKVIGQQLVIDKPISQKMLFVGQNVKIIADCNADIAIIAQIAEIHGRAAGDVSFRGQILTVEPNAVIEGDLDVKAQAVEIYGTVKGQIAGQYQSLKRNGQRSGGCGM